MMSPSPLTILPNICFHTCIRLRGNIVANWPINLYKRRPSFFVSFALERRHLRLTLLSLLVSGPDELIIGVIDVATSHEATAHQAIGEQVEAKPQQC